MAQEEPGTRSAGLNTTQLPCASAGATFQAGMADGKFQGAMMPTTPSGSRVISTSTPGRTEEINSPERRSTSPAKNLNTLPARTTSPTPSARVLPSSRDSSWPSSSLRAMISRPAFSRMSARACVLNEDHAGNAARAAAIARSVWAASACAYSPMTSEVSDGLMLRVTVAPAIHSPAMRFENCGVLMAAFPPKECGC